MKQCQPYTSGDCYCLWFTVHADQ